jgi:hypothetical protein
MDKVELRDIGVVLGTLVNDSFENSTLRASLN